MVRETTSVNLRALTLDRPTDPLKPITRGTGAFFSPRVSPDGRWIAAASGSGARSRLVKLPVMGGDPIPLTSGEYLDTSPAWSPDGTRIAFGSDRNGRPGVWVMNSDGQQQRRVDVGPVSTNLLVTWLPDGRIAWQQLVAGNFLTFRIRAAAGGEESVLTKTDAKGFVFLPRFSPQGNQVAVNWNRSGTPETGLWLLSWPGRDETFLKRGAAPLGWSRDGSAIYAASVVPQSDIFVVSSKTGESHILAHLLGVKVDGGDVTPDGKYLVLSLEERKADAWLVENFDPRGR
jgi:Tol biopolymer transport system component